VIEGAATLQELKTSWTLDDIERAIAVLNMKSAIEKKVDKIIKARIGKPTR
jgi:ABC-type uncharacterized transport system substrate-binding protein